MYKPAHKPRPLVLNKLSEEKMVKFIDSRISLHEMFVQNRYRTRKCWELVGEQSGINEPWTTLSKRWYYLLDKYKRFKNSPNPVRIHWPHYEKLHKYFSQHYKIKPPKVINSEQGNTYSFKTSTVDVPIDQSSSSTDIITDKELRKATRVLTKILNNSFSIDVSSSDSE